MPLHLTIVADVFRNETQAKHAIESLRRAGFEYEQIGVAMRGHEGIDLQNDLENLGVPSEDARYYAQEVKAGHTVVSVRPDGREQEAHEIMQRSGAFTDTDTATAQDSLNEKQQAAWDQAIAANQAYLAEQLASHTQQDFHQPRSLRPRTNGASATTQNVQAEPDPATFVQQPLSDASTVQQDEDTAQMPVLRPSTQNTKTAPQTTDSAAAALDSAAREPLSPLEDEPAPTFTIDEEEVFVQPLTEAQSGLDEDVLQPQESGKSNLVRTSVVVGGLLLGLGVAVLIGVLRREQIRQFFRSTTRTLRKR